jgi:hypothetical protein
MAQEEFEYRGHHVAIDTFSIGKKFGWQYQIDEEPPVPIKESAVADEVQAIAESAAAARSVIDAREGKA